MSKENQKLYTDIVESIITEYVDNNITNVIRNSDKGLHSDIIKLAYLATQFNQDGYEVIKSDLASGAEEKLEIIKKNYGNNSNKYNQKAQINEETLKTDLEKYKFINDMSNGEKPYGIMNKYIWDKRIISLGKQADEYIKTTFTARLVSKLEELSPLVIKAINQDIVKNPEEKVTESKTYKDVIREGSIIDYEIKTKNNVNVIDI